LWVTTRKRWFVLRLIEVLTLRERAG
jgi:hypothetical protein